MGELEGKLALVTGGARNVGKAIAKELAARGAHVIVNFFHALDEAKRTRAELEKAGARIDLIRASVARPDQVTRMFAEIEQRFGHLDILVNNAASGALLPLDQVTDEHLDRGFDTNLKGALRCARHAVPLMTRRGGGAIVNVSALGGSQFVMADYFACAPAKAAMETLTRYLAAEYAPLNIRVNTASAAMLVSQVADSFPRAAEMQEVIRRATPMGRLGTPEEFADVVAFLAGDQSRWITGQVVLADGGLSLGTSLLAPPPDTPVIPPAPTVQLTVDPAVPAPSSRRTTTVDCDGPDAVAIVGMGLSVAGANSPEEFWDLRLSGAELFVPVPGDRWRRAGFHATDPDTEDKSYQDRCVFITDFVPAAGVLAGEASDQYEFTTLWLRHCMVQAMRGVTTRPDDRFSCVIGYTPDGNQHLEEAGVLAAVADRAERIVADLDVPGSTRPELLDEIRETLRHRYRHGAHADPSRFLPHRLGATAMAGILPPDTTLLMIDTACSSSLYAVDIGSKALLDGDVDVAVCGGAFALGPRGTVLFSKLHGLSKRGEVRALDAAADGVIFADGAAVVVLKRLRRARADGDHVLAVIRAVGTSSDGKGKAVYAPNPDGQARAVTRAAAGPVDLIIAHATGTPAGDLAEFTTLRERYGTHPTAVTSNKSLFGHTGWAAGVVSIIEVLMGLRHGTIAPQFRFTGPPDEFGIAESRLRIPTRAVDWPTREDRPRTAAVSGFGFGGTNAHLVVAEPPPSGSVTPAPQPAPPTRERMAIVGWAAHLPGLADREAVRTWLLGTGRQPDSSFGEVYPTPGLGRVRLPPRTVRTIDRCQLMALECGHQLRKQLGDAWAAHTDRTGVFIGHLGPTRAGMLYANRCYLDDMADALRSNSRLAGSGFLPEFLDRLRDDARRLVPASNEDSFPGMMPNIISARVANYFGLNGPNLTTDAGLGSALAAFDVARRYLRAGDIDVALVGGINGNTLPELRAMLGNDVPGLDLAEGAFLFAVVGERLANRAGLRVLGWIPERGPDGSRSGTRRPYQVDCDLADPDNARYLGGAGALAVLRALLTSTGSVVDIGCHDRTAPPPMRLELPSTGHAGKLLDRRFTTLGAYAPGSPPQVRRHVPELVPEPATVTGRAEPFLPDGVVLLTDRPELVASLGPLPPHARVLSCAPIDAVREGWHHLREVTPDTVDAALAGRPPQHVRVLADLTVSAPAADCVVAGAPDLESLHDLTFLVLQRCGDAPVTALLLGALADGAPHPYLGLFSGLLKTAHLESPDSGRFLLATDTQDVTAGVRAAERESANGRTLPVVFDVAGERRVYRLTEQPVELDPDTPARLTEESVVLAVGGARGITAELMKALAEHFGPKLYVVGSNPLDRYPDEVFTGSDADFAAARRPYLRAQLAARPGTPVAVLNREYDRMADARAARRNLDAMAAHCGPGRVRYLACDVTDPDAVRQVVDTVLAAEPGIDLLVNAAGRNGSALIPDKDFATFRAVRDVKLHSHRNLKRALADRPPRLWCGFGSLLGFFGQRGEADYASGNDFLATASAYASQAQGLDEFTIGWTLWSGVGMGANDLVSRYYDRKGFYTPMAVGEGVHHFVRELHAVGRTPYLVHLGDAERRTVDGFYPGFFTAPAALEPTGPAGFYLRRETGRSLDTVTFECVFELSADGYLRHHLVRGHPTLPGMFMTEVAAEAAATLRPGWCPVGFTDLRFERFLRLYGEQPATKHIHARVVDETADLVTVEVRLATDVVAPNGTVLARNRTHFSARVLLAREFPTVPRWQPWQPDPAEVAVPDPYHHPDAPALLTGPFVTTTETRLHPRGKRARYAPQLAADDPTWSRLRVPALLLDGLARTGVLNLVDGHLVPVAAPVAVRRIDLYQDANDLTLAARGPIELYATPAEFALTGPGAAGNRFVAIAPDGRVVAQIKDVTATVLGHLDLDTDRFRSADDLAAVRTATR